MKGIVYIMNTAVSGLIKIGKTGLQNYNERMRHLERNGYYNVSGLKQFFAIELNDYADKEALLHEIFSKHRVDDSELFALDCELVKQLLLAFDGQVVYPKNINKEHAFDDVVRLRKQGSLFSFYQKGLKNGDVIVFAQDKSISATVAGEREVEYDGEVYKLSPLTREIFQKKGKRNASGAYQGAAYWLFNGKKLKDLEDK